MIEISIIIDSSIIVSAYNTDDQNHEIGLKIIADIESERYGKEIFISDFIFDETMTAIFVRMKDKEAAVNVGRHLMNSCIMLKVTERIFSEAFDVFSRKNILSFTDCTIISMAESYGISHIATFDKEIKRHFRNCVDS